MAGRYPPIVDPPGGGGYPCIACRRRGVTVEHYGDVCPDCQRAVDEWAGPPSARPPPEAEENPADPSGPG